MIGEAKGGNHAGTEEMIRVVSNFLQAEINYYLKINFVGFKSFIDAIGGIDVELPKPVTLTFSQRVIPAGKQHIDGYLALKLAQERYSLPEGDFGRQKNQRLLIEALIHKLSQPQYVKKWPELLQQVKNDLLDTNLSVENMLSLAWTFKEISQQEISHIQIPGYGQYGWDPLVKGNVYYWIPDRSRVKEIMAQIYGLEESRQPLDGKTSS